MYLDELYITVDKKFLKNISCIPLKTAGANKMIQSLSHKNVPAMVDMTKMTTYFIGIQSIIVTVTYLVSKVVIWERS